MKSFDVLGGKTPVSSITRAMAADLASDLVRKGATKRTAINCVSNIAEIFTILIQQGYLTKNVVKGVMVTKKRDKAQQRRAEGHQWGRLMPTSLRPSNSLKSGLNDKVHHR